MAVLMSAEKDRDIDRKGLKRAGGMCNVMNVDAPCHAAGRGAQGCCSAAGAALHYASGCRCMNRASAEQGFQHEVQNRSC